MRPVVESSHYLSFFIPHLSDRYAPKFIHLIRDGRGFVASGMNRRRWYFLPRPLWLLVIRLEPVLRLRRWQYFKWEYHRLLPPRAARTRFEKLAWLWSEYNLEIDRMLVGCGAAAMRVKLEDFRDDPRQTINMIMSFIGVGSEGLLHDMVRICTSRPNISSRRPFPLPDQWDEPTVWRYQKWAGQASSYFGYEY